MIDWARVAELYEDFGEAMFAEILGAFLQDMEAGQATLGAAQTPEDLRAAFHFLKGAALNLGMTTLADLCEEGERIASDGARPDELAAKVQARVSHDCQVLVSEWRMRVGEG